MDQDVARFPKDHEPSIERGNRKLRPTCDQGNGEGAYHRTVALKVPQYPMIPGGLTDPRCDFV